MRPQATYGLPASILLGAQSPFQASPAMPSVAGMMLMSIEHGNVPFPHAPQGLVPLQASVHLLQPLAQPLILSLGPPLEIQVRRPASAGANRSHIRDPRIERRQQKPERKAFPLCGSAQCPSVWSVVDHLRGGELRRRKLAERSPMSLIGQSFGERQRPTSASPMQNRRRQTVRWSA